MKLNFLALICIAVLCIILMLGLWPFHSPVNDVSWLRNHNGLRFGRFGSVMGSGVFQISSPRDNSEVSLEIWLQPNRVWDSSTFLAFYKPENLLQFSLHQSQLDLLIRTSAQQYSYRAGTANLYVRGVFGRKPRPVFITITSGMKGAWIYTNGVLAAAEPEFPLSAGDFTGRLVLGDSPGQASSWSGDLLGVAIYRRQLTAIQVMHNYAAWKRTGRPEITGDERNTALYLFDEHAGDVARDKARSGVDLFIPKRYMVMDKITLEPFWTEFSMSWSFWGAVLKNIVGFVPFGFCFYAYLAAVLPIKRATLVTVALGTVVSVTIEILQAFLPTRDSGTTDIITNTIGTWVGVASYKLSIPILGRLVPGFGNFARDLYIPLSHFLSGRRVSSPPN